MYILESAQQSVGSTPILNFVQFLLVGIQEGNYEFIKKLVLQDYAAVLKRDGLLFDKIDKICERAFGGQGLKPVNPMQAMMANMFGMGKK